MITNSAADSTDDWTRFSSISQMVNHWERPGWTPGRSAYYWYLTFKSAELRAVTRRIQQQLDGLSLDVVETEWLHLSVVRLGWSDQVDVVEVLEIAEAAANRCRQLSRFRLEVGPLAGSAGAVRLSVNPWRPIINLRDQLIAEKPFFHETAMKSEFLPHITIAYNNHSRPAGPVISAVAAARDVPTTFLDVEDVALVDVRRDGHAYKWDTLARVSLGKQ